MIAESPAGDLDSTRGDERPRSRRGVWILTASSALLLAWAVGLFVQGAPTYPAPDNDEVYLFGYVRHAVLFGESHHRHFTEPRQRTPERVISHYPPLSMKLRILWQRTWGADRHGATRWLSILEALGLGLLIGLALRRQGAPPWVAILAVAALLAQPAVRQTFRAFRFEQDTCFFGALALLLPAAVLSPRRALVVWALSGAAGGVAVSMHPRGLLFAPPLALALLGAGEAWRRLDALRIRTRILAFAAGAMVPIGFTAAWYLADIPAMTRFWETKSRQYAVLEERKTNVFKDYYAWPPGLGISDRTRAAANTLLRGADACGTTDRTFLDCANRIVSWSGLAVLFAAGVAALLGWLRGLIRPSSGSLALSMVAPLLIGPPLAIVVHLRSAPSENYLIYPWMFGGLAAGAWAALASGLLASPRAALRRLGGLVLGAIAVATGVHLTHGLLAEVSRPAVTWMFEDDFRAQEEMTERLSLRPREAEGGVIYADLASFPAGGRRAWGAWEWFYFWPGTALEPRRSWVVYGPLHDALLLFPAARPTQPTEGERKERVDQMAEGLVPVGAILYQWEPGPATIRQRLWWLPPDEFQDRHRQGDRDVIWFIGSRRNDYLAVPEATQPASPAPLDPADPLAERFQHVWSWSLPPARYLLAVSAEGAYGTALCAQVMNRPTSSFQAELRGLPQGEPANWVPLHVEGDEDAPPVRVLASVKDFEGRPVETPPRLHVWRLEPWQPCRPRDER